MKYIKVKESMSIALLYKYGNSMASSTYYISMAIGWQVECLEVSGCLHGGLTLPPAITAAAAAAASYYSVVCASFNVL